MVSESGGRKRDRLGEQRSASGRSFVFSGLGALAYAAAKKSMSSWLTRSASS
jgi:hypothetical protein